MIVVLKKGKGFLVASDVFNDAGGQRNDSFSLNELNIFIDEPSKTILGCPNLKKYLNVLRYGLNLKLPKEKQRLTMEFVVNEFAPSIVETFKEYKYLPENKFPQFEKDILILKKNKGYLLLIGGGVMELGDEEAIGNGSNYAYPVILANSYIKDPEERIIDVYKKCYEKCMNIGKTLYIIDSETLETKIINNIFE